jgi:thiamine transport system permease protein
MLAGLALLPIASVLLGGFRVAGEWSLEPWRSLLDPAHPAHVANFSLPVVLARSLVYAAGSAALAVGLCLCLIYGTRRLAPGSRRLAEAAAALPLGTSSLLIGLGLFLAFGPTGIVDLRASPWAIVVAHTLVSLPFAARLLLPAMDMHDRRLDEAATLLGASPSRIAWRIHRPLLAAPLAAAAGFAVALSLGDYGASLLLMRSDTAGLAVWIGRHDRPFDALAHAQATALAGLLAVLAAVAYAFVEQVRPARTALAKPPPSAAAGEHP